MNLSSLSIFFPVYNDWGTIATMTIQAIYVAEKITQDYEIILVDDGSEEKTQNVLNFLKGRFPQIRVIHHEKNKGYGGAIKTGFKEAQKEWVFYTDGDAQYDVTELEKLAEALTDDVDVVNGYKIKRNDPFYRILTGKIYQYVSKYLFSLPIKDVDCDFRLLKNSAIKKIQLNSNSGTICVEMIHKLSKIGVRFKEVPVSHYFRVSGKSQFFNCRRLLRVARDYFRLWFRLVVQKKEDEFA